MNGSCFSGRNETKKKTKIVYVNGIFKKLFLFGFYVLFIGHCYMYKGLKRKVFFRKRKKYLAL